MAGRFVRSSKYRHIFGRSTKKEQCYDNLHISKNAWDSNIIKANPLYLSVNWESGGGGAFAVIPLSHRGRLPEQIPLFRGHTAPVLDTDWSPFNDSIIASGSDDGKVFIWKVPDEFTLFSDEDESPKDVDPLTRLAGHTRKVGHVLFHPAAENVLATSSGDYSIKIWDINTGDPHYTLKHTDIVQSMSFNTNGSLLVTTCRDKKLRIWDIRQEKAALEVAGHTGAKNSRAVWMTGEADRIATTGFSKMSDRQLGLWDMRTLTEGPTGGFQMLDSISGVCMPFWDEGTKCLYLAGKGDGNIRYFEYSNDDLIFLAEYKSGDPQRGVAFLPKRGVAFHENEVMRGFKTVNDSYIEPISFIVPRRAETFQSDIYPPAYSGEPALTAEAWFAGADADPPLMDLEPIYNATAPEPGKAGSVVNSVPTSRPMSMAEIPKPDLSPVKDSPVISAFSDRPEKPIPSPIVVEQSTKVVERISEKQRSPVKSSYIPPVNDKPLSARVATFSQQNSASISESKISEQLAHITSLLEVQNRTLKSQNEQIGELTKELDVLKNRVDANAAGDEKDEIIRKLELELEEARS
ncbi:Coronin-like protein crn1 [Rhizina undulata]